MPRSILIYMTVIFSHSSSVEASYPTIFTVDQKKLGNISEAETFQKQISWDLVVELAYYMNGT